MKYPLSFTSKKAALLPMRLKFFLLAAILVAQGTVALAQKKPVKKILKAANDADKPALFISSEGNVGIGISGAPKHKLTLGGTLDVLGNSILFNPDPNNYSSFIQWNLPDDFGVPAGLRDQRMAIVGNQGVKLGTMENFGKFFPILRVGFSNQNGAVDIMTSARTGIHPGGLILYGTGMGDKGSGVEFRTNDATEGIGFSKNLIYQTNIDKNLSFEARGTGRLVFHTGDQQRMIIDGGGNATFKNNLDIAGTTQIHNRLHMDGNAIYFRQGVDDVADYIAWKPMIAGDVTSDRMRLTGWQGVELGSTRDQGGNTRTTLTVGYTGFVGIDNNNPEFPLDVRSIRGTGDGYTGREFTYVGVNGIYPNRGFATCSVFANGDFVTKNAFVGSNNSTFSDIRLKKDITSSSPKDDLEKLNAIQVVNYKMIDTVANNQAYKKVIAQQVQQVYPMAVGTSFGSLPNVFQRASSVTLLQDSLYVITVAKPHPLKAGDKIELKIAGAADATVLVIQINSDKSFTVASKLALDKQQVVFVYGTVATDVLTVDYDAISMLNVSATQQLSKTINQQQQEIAQLKKQNTELLQAMTLVMARLQKVEDNKPQNVTTTEASIGNK
ncbi:tail fiber domain-containing protein [Mucilaginibacter sp.]|uniref:tail fiber domain-containing protein n=1 Tax=Mucilaginibacter sp. TaxID=1882438 RepID=UPI003264E219